MTRQRDPKMILFDIVESANNCLEFTRNLSFEKFEKDKKTISAVFHQIMILGEAVKRLGKDFTEKHPNIPWKKMAGMRDVLIHHYEDSDLNIAWAVIQNDLPDLIEKIKNILKILDK